MRLTTRGRYALRASLALAKLGKDGRPVAISQLSEEENISSVFLEQIFFKLRRAGVVVSVRGPGGGFNFAKSLNEVTVKEIMDAAGEDFNTAFCDKQLDSCNKVGECLSHNVMLELTKIIQDYFSRLTLASIIEKYQV